jgi:hypothetical protein
VVATTATAPSVATSTFLVSLVLSSFPAKVRQTVSFLLSFSLELVFLLGLVVAHELVLELIEGLLLVWVLRLVGRCGS